MIINDHCNCNQHNHHHHHHYHLPIVLLVAYLYPALLLRNIQSHMTGEDEVVLVRVGSDATVRTLLGEEYLLTRNLL